MISEEALANLPDDPELAFVKLEKKFREEMNANLEHAENNSLIEAAYRQYMNHTSAIAQALGLDILKEWQKAGETGNVFDIQRNFVADVDHYIIQIQIAHTRRSRGYSVALDPATKAKIRHHLSQIKETVDRLEVPQDKKDRLYDKILALEGEVDRDRTRFDAYSALFLEAASTTGKAARKLKPLMKLLQPITILFANAKDTENTQLRLPPAPTLKRLEPPQLKLPSPEPPAPDLNDDIPF